MEKAGKQAREAFALSLVTWRKERGYPTAYAFFHKSGGKRYFGVEYAYYLRMERGERLPSSDHLARILDALGSAVSHARARDQILTAYLKAMVEGHALFDPILAAPSKPASPTGSAEPEVQATVLRRVSEQTLQSMDRISDDQWQAITSSSAAVWVFYWLFYTGSSASDAHLCSQLGLQPLECAQATSRLLQAGLVQRLKNGRVECVERAKRLLSPSSRAFQETRLWISERITERLRKREGRGGSSDLYYGYFFLPVESLKQAADVVTILKEAVRKGYLLSLGESPARGTLVGVEARVAPVLDFEREP